MSEELNLLRGPNGLPGPNEPDPDEATTPDPELLDTVRQGEQDVTILRLPGKRPLTRKFRVSVEEHVINRRPVRMIVLRGTRGAIYVLLKIRERKNMFAVMNAHLGRKSVPFTDAFVGPDGRIVGCGS